ncbi:18.2 kDa class I heat shock protein [Coffea arabica]|uniref:18.2 kDa class I heat shock protein n=1 Tax=Coffea arabica TaxID=13443 RepID=A0A6P6SJH7_COFAR
MSLMPVFGGRRSVYYNPFSGDGWDAPVNNHQPVHQKQYHGESGVTAWAPPVHGASSHHAVQAPSSFASATVDWRETPEAYIFRTELPPGVRREDVRVELEDNKILKISCEKYTEKEDRHDQNYYHHVIERSRCKFLTAFGLPQDSRVDQIRSTIENGVLTVRVPRWEPMHHSHHHVIPVEIL